MGRSSRMDGEFRDSPDDTSVMSLLFAAGARPTAAAVGRVLDRKGDAQLRARVSHTGETYSGQVELLVQGLTFDIAGIAPAEAAPIHPVDSRYGLDDAFDPATCEAVSFAPGPHLSGGLALMPVVRVMAELGAMLATQLGARAVCWRPSRSYCHPAYFQRVISSWLDGGAFPALGLTSLRPVDGGAVASQGLAFFIGQELLVDPVDGETVADTVKLAMRIVDHIVAAGKQVTAHEFIGPDGESLRLVPSGDLQCLRIRRDA